VLIDAPLQDNQWLIEVIPSAFTLIAVGAIYAPEIEGMKRIGFAQNQDDYQCYQPQDEKLRTRYGDGILYLVRPDHHIAAAFTTAYETVILKAYQKALGYL